MRAPTLRATFETLFPDEMIVDSFAGGGGASTGIEAALGRPVHIAVNHSPEAIAVHKANHPETQHYIQNVWEIDPKVACGSRPVGLFWASPTCTHFSRAKGSRMNNRNCHRV
jgi:DNA (cytosine-5)-methyltransferase 1